MWDAALHPLRRNAPFARRPVDLFPGRPPCLARPRPPSERETENTAGPPATHRTHPRSPAPPSLLDRAARGGAPSAAASAAARRPAPLPPRCLRSSRAPRTSGESRRMRCRTRRAVSGRVDQIGSSTASTSPRRIRSTGASPMTGKAWRLQRAPPVGRVLAVPPARQVRFVDLPRGVSEGRHVGASAFGQRIASGADQGLVGECERAGFGEADRRVAPEPHVPAPAVDHDSLHPRPRPRSRDAQIEPVAVAVHSRLADGLDLGSGQSRHVQPHISPTLDVG